MTAPKTRAILRRKPKGLGGKAGTGPNERTRPENDIIIAPRGTLDMSHQRTKKGDLRLEVVKALGGKCVRCGIEDLRVLQIDHIHGGGGRRGLPPYPKILERMDEAKTLYQVLCANCNFLKAVENKERRTKPLEKYRELGPLERN